MARTTGSKLIYTGDLGGFTGTFNARAGGATTPGINVIATNHFGGTFAVDSGTLQIGNADATGTLGANNIANNGTLLFNSTKNLGYNGDISGAAGKLTVNNSAGTLVLGGNNTYEGATTVTAGTLLVNGALGNTAVSVAPGATIGGSGTLAGTLGLGSTSVFEIVDLNDPLSVAGIVTFGSGFGIANLSGVDWDSLEMNTPYTILTGSTQDFSTAELANFGLTNAANVGSGDRKAYFEQGSLRFVVIPEPSATVMGGLGLLALLRRRRD
ncbi:MAG: autotransporter-associated beta strand repeat-containing protein [Verrucomicrobia bacterium]|nr:autotransporter-associated beta strand repeat-containing protein [Verrucomicrobiota bacterium]